MWPIHGARCPRRGCRNEAMSCTSTAAISRAGCAPVHTPLGVIGSHTRRVGAETTLLVRQKTAAVIQDRRPQTRARRSDVASKGVTRAQWARLPHWQGRKQRILPPAAAATRCPAWATEQDGQPGQSLFPARPRHPAQPRRHRVLARGQTLPVAPYTPRASSKRPDYAVLPGTHTAATSGFTSLGCYNAFSQAGEPRA